MTEVVITSAARTPVGNFGGAFRDMTATQLGTVVAKEAIKRAGIDAGIFDEVVFGSGGQPIKEANVARQIALFAGVPERIPAFSVQRNCASGIQAVTSGAQLIKAGDGDVCLVGGAENMSQAPYMVFGARWGLRLRHAQFEDSLWDGLTDAYSGLVMGETAENLADRYNITREEQDRYAMNSHQKAFRAIRMGKFKDEIVPVEVPKKPQPEVISQDEGPLAGLSMERLAMLPPVFKKGGTVTAANACPLNDAAAALVIMSERKAHELGLEPLAHIKSYGYAGCDPRYMGLGPVFSTRVALERADLNLSSIELIEINEAFAAQAIACQKELGYPDDIFNVNGGGIALGHPIGATGVRLITTLVYEMKRRSARYGLATLCVGGGQGASIILERR